MSAPGNAEHVFQTVANGTVPPPEDGGRWPQEKTDAPRGRIGGGLRP